MKIFLSCTWFLLLSEVVSRFLLDDAVSKNVEICEEIHGMARNKLNQLLKHSTIFSKDFDQKGLCFLECVYRTSNVTDEKEFIRKIGLVTIIRKEIPFHSDLDYSVFSSNIMLLCNAICDVGGRCSKAVERVECLEVTVHSIMKRLQSCIRQVILKILGDLDIEDMFYTGDIDIRFEKLNHGDVPFDGPGSVLAHTFYPVTFLNGMQKSFIHFDDEENWTVNSTKGVDFFQTAVHEIGHSLGLKHSKVEDSVMLPGRVNYTRNFTLGKDDIRGIQSLYGINT